MRVLFAGSPAIAVPALEALAALGGECTVAGLLTCPDSPKGRSGRPGPTDCAEAFRRLFPASVPALKPEKLDGAAREQAAALKPDLLVSFAYGKIFGPKFLALFPMGGINIHPSLLPKYRGPSPIPAVIMNREKETGITIQRLAEETDSGDILFQEKAPLGGRETAGGLSRTMAEWAAALLPSAIRGIAAGTLSPRPQVRGEATYCSLISKSDGLIGWGMGAAEIDARIRAFDPWPLSWTLHGGLELFILKAEARENVNGARAQAGRVLGKDNDAGILIQTGEGALAVQRLQYRGKKALEWKDFLNGARNFIGARLG
ncbi:MAG: methionyl-tRNA formyltransferase [Treponema sp.]|nr:methionyl-tRNA formyltransferase [Treponema sp.]